jgi:hypothetical protein
MPENYDGFGIDHLRLDDLGIEAAPIKRMAKIPDSWRFLEAQTKLNFARWKP